MKVEAELKTKYKITVGDDGICMGQYYSEDDWEESYYGEDLKEMAEELSIKYINGLPRAKFYFSKVEVLIYNNKQFDNETISWLNKYKNDDETLKKEYNEFLQYWRYLEPDRAKMREVQKLKEKRKEKLFQLKKQEEKEQKEKSEYLKLKQKYENI